MLRRSLRAKNKALRIQGVLKGKPLKRWFTDSKHAIYLKLYFFKWLFKNLCLGKTGIVCFVVIFVWLEYIRRQTVLQGNWNAD